MDSKSIRTNRYDVIVIGGGHNGLTAAAMLAGRGRKVLVLERREILGGVAAGEVFHPGYRTAGLLHDTTAVHPGVIDALDLPSHGLELTPEPPDVFAPQIEGRGLLLHHNPSQAAAEITAFVPRDAQAYTEYRAFLGRLRPFTDRMLHEPPPDIAADGLAALSKLAGDALALRRLGTRDMMEVLRITPMCVADWLNEWFESELLKCLIAAPALQGTFTGPRSPGSNANLLRWEAAAGRASRKGPWALVAALEKAARKQGVDIRTGSEVRRIRVSDGRVEGVVLGDGETIEAPVVAASCDPKRTLLHLVDPRNISAKLQHRIEKLRMRGTTAKVNLALSAPLRFACRGDLEVEYARIGERFDELERAFDAVKYGRFSTNPILDLYVPTVANPDFAPKGHSVVSILVHFAPYDLDGGWDEKRREELGDAVVDTLGRYAPDLPPSIVAREVLTPVDLEARYALTQGHIHHGEHAVDQMLVRPCPECARYETPIEGLYLCGSGSHPGGGLTCAPGSLGGVDDRQTL